MKEDEVSILIGSLVIKCLILMNIYTCQFQFLIGSLVTRK